MTPKLKTLTNARDIAYRSGNTEAYSAARAALRRDIRYAKLAYKNRVEAHFYNSSNPRQVWEGIRAITDYKGVPSFSVNSCATLVEELNIFYARFDKDNKDSVLPPLPPNDAALVLCTHDVRLYLHNINPRKAAGPDGVQGRVLKDCAAELTTVFTTIFNLSLATSWFPACLKSAIIVPVPKQTNVKSLNDYRPVALTPIMAKCFERLVITHIKKCHTALTRSIPVCIQEEQANRGCHSYCVTHTLEHLEHRNTYARLLFVGFSSAFNTILPNKLRNKLLGLGLGTTLCNWILDFLTNRTQYVRVGKHTSSTLIINTGAPQGCVLSPLLYTLFTHDCSSSSPSQLHNKICRRHNSAWPHHRE